MMPQGSREKLTACVTKYGSIFSRDDDHDSAEGLIYIRNLTPEILDQRLHNIAGRYLVHYNEHRTAPTRGSILRELRDLRDLPTERLERGVNILSRQAVAALFGGFPAPFVSLSGLTDDDAPLFVPSNVPLMIATSKSLTAREAISGRPTVLKETKRSGGMAVTTEEDERLAKSVLAELASSDPDRLRQLIDRIVELLLDTFQVRDQRGGHNTTIIDNVVPAADWKLIIDVLDVIWPMNKGEMHSSKMRAAREIIEATKRYALGDEEAAREMKRRAKKKKGLAPGTESLANLVDPKLFSYVHTLRHRINSLNISIKAIEKRLFEIELGECRGKADWSRQEPLYRRAFYPLLNWRRELERRLLFGDYRPWKHDIRRPTGDILNVPEMPELTHEMSLARKTLLLIHSAGPLVARPADSDESIEKMRAVLKRPKRKKFIIFRIVNGVLSRIGINISIDGA